MSIESLLGNIELRLAQQADLLELAQAWMERTNGIIIPEGKDMPAIAITSHQFQELVRELPLWEQIKGKLPEVTHHLQTGRIHGTDQIAQYSRIVLYSPKVLYIVRHFLADPEYSSGKRREIGSPQTLFYVLSAYNPQAKQGRGTITAKGPAVAIADGIRKHLVDEELLLDAIDLQKEWQAYRQSKGLPREYRDLAWKTLTAFLANPDYNKDGRVGNFCAPLPLPYVLKKAGRKRNVRTAAKVGDALERSLSEEQLLQCLGLTEQWKQYQQTRGIPCEYHQAAERIVRHFLADPDYCNDKRNPFGSPKNLLLVLETYDTRMNDGEGGFKVAGGEGRFIVHAIKEKKFSEEELLASLGSVDRAFENYLKTTGIPREFRRLAKRTIAHFLAQPSYGAGRIPFDQSRSLHNVLNSYDPDASEQWKRNSCPTSRVAAALRQGKITERQLLESIGLQEKWEQYRASAGLPEEHLVAASKVLTAFLQHPRYAVKYHKPGQPHAFRSVLRRYSPQANTGRGGFVHNGGEARSVDKMIGQGRIGEDSLLKAMGLLEPWKDYQKTTAAAPFTYDPNKYRKI